MMDASPELQALVEAATAATNEANLRIPSSAPGPGQSVAAWEQDVAACRRAFDDQLPDAPSLPFAGTIEEIEAGSVGGWGGRLYVPDSPATARPAVVLFHGGGFWMAGGDAMRRVADPFCRLFAERLGAVVLTVDYRLAPEFKYPAAVDDCHASYRWTVDSAPRLGVDPTRIGLFGISSGGNMAAVTALRVAAGPGPQPRVMVLMAPAVDLSGPAALADVDIHAGLGPDVVDQLTDLYLPVGADRSDPHISPGLASDLSGMPPTFVVVGEFDVLRDQCIRLADRLRVTGIPAAARRYPMTHGVAEPRTIAAYKSDVLRVLERALLSTSNDPASWFRDEDLQSP